MNAQYRQPWAYFAAGAATIGISHLLYLTLSRPSSPIPTPKPYPAPLQTSSSEHASLPYPPDALPNARDVETPYGRVHVFELGPEESTRKFVFIHGISASSFALHEVARSLAAKGSRVMVIDTFGRGWSGGPADLPYDGRLYASMILMALSSSKLHWTGAGVDGHGGFTLVGHSLGGGIAADFTRWFPELVDDLVLIAPGGMQRKAEIPLVSKLMYSGWIPEWWLAKRLGRWLRHYPITPSPSSSSSSASSDQATTTATSSSGGGSNASPAQAAAQEAADRVSPSTGILKRQHLAQDTVVWQLDHNKGFLPAFISSMRHAPIFDQYEAWAVIGMRLDALRVAVDAHTGPGPALDAAKLQGLRAGKVLLLMGEHDQIVRVAKTVPDATRALSNNASNLDVRVLDAGHDLPITHADEIADIIWAHVGWGLLR